MSNQSGKNMSLKKVAKMTFQELMKKVIRRGEIYSREHNIKFDSDFLLMKLYEEVGEASEAYLTYKGKSRKDKEKSKQLLKEYLSNELADCLGMTILLANSLDIDIEEAIDKKWINRK